MGHVAIPYKWKDFLFHSGCSFNVTSILTSGLTAGGRECRGRQTIFFTPKNLAMTSQSREKYTITVSGKCSGRRLLDQFSPNTRQRITILADKVSCRDCMQFSADRMHCIYKEFSQRGGTNLIRETLDASSHTERRLYLRVLGNRSSSNSTPGTGAESAKRAERGTG